MNKEKQLLKNTTIVSIGKICTQLITFFLLPLYTAVLTKEEYGTVDLLNTLVSLLLPIISLQIDQGVFRYLLDCREDEEKQKRTISNVVFFVLSQLAIYTILFLIISPFVHNEYKYFLLINLIANLLSNIFLQISRGLGDNTTYAIGSFLSGATTVILNVLFIVVFKMGAYGMLIATFIGNTICGSYVFARKKLAKKIARSEFNKKELKDILKYSIPLVPNMISWWIVNASDRTIISTFLGIAQNGVYSAANKFPGVFSVLYSVFNLTWTESATINIESEDRDKFFNKILDFVVRFFGGLCLATVAFMPFVFGILINEKFNDAYYQIPILLIGTMFNILVSFVGSIYVAKKLTKEIAKTSIFAAIINIAINLIGIKFIGLYAASISTAVAYFSMFIYRFFDSKKYVQLKFNAKMICSFIIIYVITMLTYYCNNTILSIIMLITVMAYVIYLNRNSMKFILKMGKKIIKK